MGNGGGKESRKSRGDSGMLVMKSGKRQNRITLGLDRISGIKSAVLADQEIKADLRLDSKANLLMGLERTLWAWIGNMVIPLTGSGYGLITFFNEGPTVWYGVFLQVMAVVFMLFATLQFVQRGSAIINEVPGHFPENRTDQRTRQVSSHQLTRHVSNPTAYWAPMMPMAFFTLMVLGDLISLYFDVFYLPTLPVELV